MPMCATRAGGSGSWRALAATLRLGAFYDLLFAVLMVAAPAALQRAFDLPLPGEPFYLRLIAVLLVMLAATYWLAAADPELYRPLVWLAIVGRLAGFGALGGSALGRSELGGLWGPALADLAFAGATLFAGRRLLLR
jgi:hypothetical protein